MKQGTGTLPTRFAVIADVHGDLPSLQRVLAAIDRAAVEAIWCLGDIVGLGATDPADVVDLIRGRCALVLAGNHDRWVTGGLPLEMLPLPRQRAELRWQRDQLSAAQLAWLATLPSHIRCAWFSLWHGSATDPATGWISSHADAADHLARQQTPVGLVGHTNRPLTCSPHRTRREAACALIARSLASANPPLRRLLTP